MILIFQFAGNPIFVMIIYKSVQISADGLQPPDVMGNLKEIMVVKSRIQAFVELVIRNGMEHFRIPSASPP